MSRFNVLDNFIVSEFMFVYSVKRMLVIRGVDNLSDHEPIILDLEFVMHMMLGLSFANLRDTKQTIMILSAINNSSVRLLNMLRLLCDLRNVALPASALLCSNLSHVPGH